MKTFLALLLGLPALLLSLPSLLKRPKRNPYEHRCARRECWCRELKDPSGWFV